MHYSFLDLDCRIYWAAKIEFAFEIELHHHANQRTNPFVEWRRRQGNLLTCLFRPLPIFEFSHLILFVFPLAFQYFEQGLNDRKNVGSELAKAGRSASISALGGSSSLGSFHFKAAPNVAGLPKSYSVSPDGSPSYLTPTQFGRQELYQQVPFAAVFGLQKRERMVSEAFAAYASELDVRDQKDLTEEERRHRQSQASLIIMDELEFDSNLVTTPLVFAIIVAAGSQFLVGYNTGASNYFVHFYFWQLCISSCPCLPNNLSCSSVFLAGVMNAPEKVVFPGHSTGAWSLAVAAFAVGGPFGAIVGGKSGLYINIFL